VEWPGFVALVILLAVARVLIFWRWRSYRLDHRQAAGLYASVIPLLLIVGFAIYGSGQFFLGLGIAAFVFGSTFIVAEFFLRAFGGEMDPPASRGYRRRP
jgi:hypothetical protein